MNERTELQTTGKLCGDVLFLIPAYTLGTTDPDETALVEANLATCPEAAAALIEYRRLVDEMRVSVPQLDPAPELEERLMVRLSGRRMPDDLAEVVVQPRAPAQSAKRSRWRSARSLLALAAASLAAAVAAVLLLVATNVYWIGRVSNLAQENSELAVQLQQQSDTIHLANLEGLSWRRLWSERDPSAIALIVWNNTDAFLYTLGMPDLPPDHVYQLWLVEPDNQRVSAGTFRVDERGRGELHFYAPNTIDDFVSLGITTEPEGGSEWPTSDPVAVGDV
jgi:anti-sigma-K factor RskA